MDLFAALRLLAVIIGGIIFFFCVWGPCPPLLMLWLTCSMKGSSKLGARLSRSQLRGDLPEATD